MEETTKQETDETMGNGDIADEAPAEEEPADEKVRIHMTDGYETAEQKLE